MPRLWRQASAEPAGAAWGTGRRWWAARAVARLTDFRVLLQGWICHLNLLNFSPSVFHIQIYLPTKSPNQLSYDSSSKFPGFTNQFFNQPIQDFQMDPRAAAFSPCIRWPSRWSLPRRSFLVNMNWKSQTNTAKWKWFKMKYDLIVNCSLPDVCL